MHIRLKSRRLPWIIETNALYPAGDQKCVQVHIAKLQSNCKKREPYSIVIEPEPNSFPNRLQVEKRFQENEPPQELQCATPWARKCKPSSSIRPAPIHFKR